VALGIPPRNVYIQNGKILQTGGSPSTTTGADGRFSLPPQESDYKLVVVADQGFAVVDKSALAASPEITVEPWGRLEGKLRMGARPGSQEKITLHYPHDPREGGVWLDYNGRTDADGRFVIERLVPGAVRVGREVLLAEFPDGAITSSSTHTVAVEIKPGETARVEIGGKGRAIFGRLKTPDGEKRKVDWTWGFHALEAQPRKPGVISRILGSAPPPKPMTRYPFRVKSDGSFRIEDVPAGEYILKLSVREPPQPGEMDTGREIGGLQKEVVVPQMPGGRSDQPLDLGTIEVEVEVLDDQ
jgi:hypothetical protein